MTGLAKNCGFEARSADFVRRTGSFTGPKSPRTVTWIDANLIIMALQPSLRQALIIAGSHDAPHTFDIFCKLLDISAIQLISHSGLRDYVCPSNLPFLSLCRSSTRQHAKPLGLSQAVNKLSQQVRLKSWLHFASLDLPCYRTQCILSFRFCPRKQ